MKITVKLYLSVTKLCQKSFWESFSSAERITVFLHHIVIDVGGGGGGGGIMGGVYLKDDAYSEKCDIYKNTTFIIIVCKRTSDSNS